MCGDGYFNMSLQRLPRECSLNSTRKYNLAARIVEERILQSGVSVFVSRKENLKRSVRPTSSAVLEKMSHVQRYTTGATYTTGSTYAAPATEPTA